MLKASVPAGSASRRNGLETAEGKEAVQLNSEYQPIAPIIVGYPKGETPFVPT